MDKIALNPAPFGFDRPLKPAERLNAEQPLKIVPKPEPVEPPTREAIDAAVRDVNETAQVIKRNLEFAVAETSGRILITVTDAETSEIVRQIPPEKLVAAAENLSVVRGLLFEDEA